MCVMSFQSTLFCGYKFKLVYTNPLKISILSKSFRNEGYKQDQMLRDRIHSHATGYNSPDERGHIALPISWFQRDRTLYLQSHRRCPVPRTCLVRGESHLYCPISYLHRTRFKYSKYHTRQLGGCCT